MIRFIKRRNGKKQTMRRTLSGVLGVAMLFCQIPITTNANHLIKNRDENIEAVKDAESGSQTLEKVMKHLVEDGVVSSDAVGMNGEKLPSCVYLNPEYIPKVELQQEGSCGAFATTYYQFSYMVNQKLGLLGKNKMKFSPYYIYTYVRDDVHVVENPNKVSGLECCYDILKEKGCVSWDEWIAGKKGTGNKLAIDTEKDSQGSVLCYTDNVTDMRNALQYRVENSYCYFEEYGEQTTSGNSDISQDERLGVIKALLANNIMPVVSYNSSYTFELTPKNHPHIGVGENVVCRAGNSGGHAVVIIGYNDEVGVDTNGNGSLEGAEKGAFKIRNSWGSNENSTGDFWVLYDAVLNNTSQLPTSEEEVQPVTGEVVIVEAENGKKLICYQEEEELQLITEKYDTVTKFFNEVKYIPTRQSGVYEQKLTDVYSILKTMYGEFTDTENAVWEVWKKERVYDVHDLICAFRNKHYGALPKNWFSLIDFLGQGKMFYPTPKKYGLSSSTKGNSYTFISVDKKDVKLVGQIDYQLDLRYDYSVKFDALDDNGEVVKSKKPITRMALYGDITSSEVYGLTDFVDLESSNITQESLKSMLGPRKWKMTATIGNENASQYFNFSLTDELGNVICSEDTENPVAFQSVDNEKKEKVVILESDLKRGDVDYDGAITKADIAKVYNVFNNVEEFSNL